MDGRSRARNPDCPNLFNAPRQPLRSSQRNGTPAAVVVSVEEWDRKTARRGNLAEFLLASPLRGSELDLDRLSDEARDLPL